MIIPSGYSQVNLIHTLSSGSRPAEVTFGVANSGGDPPGTIAGDVLTAWTTNLKSMFVSGMVLDSILVKNGPNSSGPFASLGVGVAYSGSGELLPGQVATLIRKNTLLGGRHGRGRWFWPGVFRGMLNLGTDTIASATVTALDGAFNDFIDDLTAAAHPVVLLHGDSTAPTQLTSVAVEATLATQRRRIRK